MNWNRHSELTGSHATLSGSKWHWINYDDERMKEVYKAMLAVDRGTRLHAFASECINLHQRLPRSSKTLNMYVNDAIGYMMTPEQVLYYSPNCYGTADSISFNHKLLRIHDLKTGNTPAHMEQLMIYAALFCLEYKVKPSEIDMELRIYQNDEVSVCNPDPNDIFAIMNKIISFDKLIDRLRMEEA